MFKKISAFLDYLDEKLGYKESRQGPPPVTNGQGELIDFFGVVLIVIVGIILLIYAIVHSC